MIRSAVVAVMLFAAAGCAGDVEPRIVAGIDACGECGMVIDTPDQACGFVDAGEFVTFDSPACLLRSHDARRGRGLQLPTEVYFADHRDGSLHPADTVTFVLTEHVPTVMQSGVLCYASRETAEQTVQHPDERVTDWNGYRLARGTPDRVITAWFGPAGMDPDAVEASKGELVLWNVASRGLDRDVVVSIQGYPEVGEITVPASGAEIAFRMRAVRPGIGFPVMAAGAEQPVGRLRVVGAHTADEEAP